jgi:hypothetical protein
MMPRERERDAVEDAGRLLSLPERFPISAVIETQILSCNAAEKEGMGRGCQMIGLHSKN